MKLDELMCFVGQFFEKENIDYYVFGATAMNFWVPPRNTVDLDAVLCIDKKSGRIVLEKLKGHGFRITTDLVRKFLEGRMIKLVMGDTELDLKLGKTPHEQEGLKRSKRFQAKDYQLRIATPEDLILFKLQSWRRQDQADIERMLNERTDLDTVYIKSWLTPLESETGAPMTARWKEMTRQ